MKYENQKINYQMCKHRSIGDNWMIIEIISEINNNKGKRRKQKGRKINSELSFMTYTFAKRNNHMRNKQKIVLKKFIRPQSVTCTNI